MAELREAPFSFHDLLEATCPSGLRFRLDGEQVLRVCLWCDEAFPQDDEGWRALKSHEMEHGSATTCDASELDGLRLRIVTVGVQGPYGGEVKPEIWGVDDANGVVYYLANSYQQRTVWKWKLGAGSGGHGDLSVAMLTAAACP